MTGIILGVSTVILGLEWVWLDPDWVLLGATGPKLEAHCAHTDRNWDQTGSK